jgi:6-phosphogluconolactonase
VIRILENLEALSREAASLFVTSAIESVEARGSFYVFLSGGETPKEMYRWLGREEFKGQVPWAQAHLFWGDERCVPPTDIRSNERMVRETLLSHVTVPDHMVHPIRCVGSPAEAARRYDAVLRSLFYGPDRRPDLVLLGLGENGHTASLFPGCAAAQEDTLHAAAVCADESGLARVTLTASLINRARRVVFLVAGNSKAAIVKEVLEGSSPPANVPARLIHPLDGELVWLLDRSAAAELSCAQSDAEGDAL